MKRTITVRAAALTAVAALGLSSLGLGAAFAVEAKDTARVSEIADTNKYSLTVHKFTPPKDKDTFNARNNGLDVAGEQNLHKQLVDDQEAKPVNGIKFKIQRITNIKLTTNEGWRQAKKVADAFKQNKTVDGIKGATVCGDNSATACTVEDPGTTVTTANDGTNDGIAKFANLAPGYYLVTEDLAGSDADEVKVVGDDTIKKDQILPAESFLVAVPMTHPIDLNKWVDHVHVFPKNSTASIDKSVKDEDAAGAGNTPGDDTGAPDNQNASGDILNKSEITYTIATQLPIGLPTYKSFKVVDALDSKLTYIGDEALSGTDYVAEKVDKVYLVTGGGNVDLERTTHYKITKDPETKTYKDRTVTLYTMALTPEGIKKAIAARDASGDDKASKIVWELNARVNGMDDAAEVPNTAFILPPNESKPDWTSDRPNDETISKYGKVKISKVNEDGVASAKMAGAEFELWTCKKDGTLEKQVFVKNKKTWTTAGDDSSLEIVGLQLNDWKNGSKPGEGEIAEGNRDYYCLKEIKAPSGYELLPNPVQFQLVQEDMTTEKTVTVKNIPKNGGPKLPVTGGQGIALLVTAGGLLVAGSVIYTVAAARKRKQQA